MPPKRARVEEEDQPHRDEHTEHQGVDTPPSLGTQQFPNTAYQRFAFGHDEKVRVQQRRQDLTFQKAGPTEKLFFNPEETTAAIVTCGGVCPGLNNVIRSLVLELLFNYGIKKCVGIRNGYAGLNPALGIDPLELTPETVRDVHRLGGTMLGTSRGAQPVSDMVDFLIDKQINLLFCLGGDGTMRGANALAEEVLKREALISVIGIPKTIDNDIAFVGTSFGYMTAVEEVVKVIDCAHAEARSAQRGIGLVKVMGRAAGFIAAGAAQASQEVNYCLIPEVAFPMQGLLDHLQERLKSRTHAVILVAEGAGQHLFSACETKVDASGNVKAQDIGQLLAHTIPAHFAERGIDVTLKYIDPSYIIRSVPANTADRVLCDKFARSAAHAAMSGYTATMVGLIDGCDFVLVPLTSVAKATKTLSTEGDLWTSVLHCTGQPVWHNKT